MYMIQRDESKDYSLVVWNSIRSEMRLDQQKWVVFDADNTLWAVEHLYDEARRELCDFLESRGVPAQESERFQQYRDKELHRTYGYSACRFARSFEDTVLHFLSNACSEDVRHARTIALSVFDQRAQPAPGLEASLIRLKRAGFSLAIITAGERWVQERRLADFHLREMFSIIQIVEAKTVEVFTAFSRSVGISPANAWMVGDSLRSDILPADAAGLRTILVNASNWTFVERHDHEVPPRAMVVQSLSEVPGIVLQEAATPAR